MEDGQAVSPPYTHLWLAAGYRGEDKGKDWVEKTLGWSVDLVERPRKPAPKEVLMAWAREWAKEGVKVDWQKLLPPEGLQVLPRRWVVERTISWIDQNRRMSKDYERLCASGEALVYAAMIRLMVRRLVQRMRTFHTVSEGEFCELRVDGVLRSSPPDLTQRLQEVAHLSDAPPAS